MASGTRPGYMALQRSGQLKKRGEALWNMLNECRLCPRECGVNRLKGEKGFCNATSALRVASYHAHFGEERPLVGVGGSGTIFLSHCNLGCIFCQNWDISHHGSGEEVMVQDLARMMLELQDQGCHNINLVSPTHYAPHAVLALVEAAERGLRLPLVWNTSGWEKPEILRVLDGVVDIYLADDKYADPEMSATYSQEAYSYPEFARAALLEMNRQVGVAYPGPAGVILKGLMIRHLVMPSGVSSSAEVMRWIASHLPANTYVNIMIQYHPAYRAYLYPEIDRPVTREEYLEVVRIARASGLSNLDVDQ